MRWSYAPDGAAYWHTVYKLAKDHGDTLPDTSEIPRPVPGNQFVWDTVWGLIQPDCRQTISTMSGILSTYFDWVQVRTVLEEVYEIPLHPIIHRKLRICILELVSIEAEKRKLESEKCQKNRS